MRHIRLIVKIGKKLSKLFANKYDRNELIQIDAMKQFSKRFSDTTRIKETMRKMQYAHKSLLYVEKYS